MKTLYITAGHSVAGPDKGASSPYGVEAVEARKFVTDLSKALYKKGVYVYTDNDNWTLLETINWLGTKVKAPDTTIDIHFNAFNATSTGTEVLIADSHTEKELELAYNIVKIISETLEIPTRGDLNGYKGVKTESQSQHPRLGILSTNKLATASNVLVELCFISNPIEMQKYRANYNLLIEKLSDYLAK